ncbi:hypothetical protein [Streptomyces sp. GESEQ-35]|uniref:hypothetical protein n=1 Tax=Streptomyces sp. GESEQ-35 TaxID=2812657 RepID=UPI001FF34D67|nr:hypothetical protein [Streptomyces sp. GESEQ-35]
MSTNGASGAQRRVRLGTWPTPLEPAPRLAAALGLDPADLWVKRDDLTGLGAAGTSSANWSGRWPPRRPGAPIPPLP